MRGKAAQVTFVTADEAARFVAAHPGSVDGKMGKTLNIHGVDLLIDTAMVRCCEIIDHSCRRGTKKILRFFLTIFFYEFFFSPKI